MTGGNANSPRHQLAQDAGLAAGVEGPGVFPADGFGFSPPEPAESAEPADEPADELEDEFEDEFEDEDEPGAPFRL